MTHLWDAELRTKRRRVIILALLCLAALVYIDWLTGPSVSVTCFYLLPVFFLSWYGGWRLGMVVAVLHGIIWLAIDFRWLNGFQPIMFWNFFVRTITFSGVVWLVRLSKSLTSEVERLVDDKTASLKREVETRIINETAIRGLANQLSAAEDAERRRLGLELHDSLGQLLTLLKLRLESASAGLPAESQASMRESLGILATVIQQTRLMTFELYPSMLDQLGLTTALQRYAEQLAPHAGVTVRVADAGPDVLLPREHAAFLFRAAKELVTNAIKHGKAREIVLQIRRRSASVRIVVNDDGIGFDPQSTTSPGLGLSWMRERLFCLGGTLDIQSAPGSGTRASIDLPTENLATAPAAENNPEPEALAHGQPAVG